MEAIGQIRSLTGKQAYVSGLSALVTDLKAICEKEEPIYVTIAVCCALAAMDGSVQFVFKTASIGDQD